MSPLYYAGGSAEIVETLLCCMCLQLFWQCSTYTVKKKIWTPFENFPLGLCVCVSLQAFVLWSRHKQTKYEIKEMDDDHTDVEWGKGDAGTMRNISVVSLNPMWVNNKCGYSGFRTHQWFMICKWIRCFATGANLHKKYSLRLINRVKLFSTGCQGLYKYLVLVIWPRPMF